MSWCVEKAEILFYSTRCSYHSTAPPVSGGLAGCCWCACLGLVGLGRPRIYKITTPYSVVICIYYMRTTCACSRCYCSATNIKLYVVLFPKMTVLFGRVLAMTLADGINCCCGLSFFVFIHIKYNRTICLIVGRHRTAAHIILHFHFQWIYQNAIKLLTYIRTLDFWLFACDSDGDDDVERRWQ